MHCLRAKELVSFCVASGKKAEHLKEKFVETVNIKTKKNLLVCCKRIQVLPDGTAHGKEWTYCSGSGFLQTEAEWKNGLLNGKRKIYYDGTNQVSSERDFVDGLENGKLVSYSPDGEVEVEAETKDGFFHGKWIYYVGGYPRVERNYVLGVREGKSLLHSLNGKYTEITCYENSLVVPEKTQRVEGINPRPLDENMETDDENYAEDEY
ncbi:conserved hypothetical protein [Lausannevirus]|uniref:MORN repeat-containing protein n=1 Tax=Lausannevirus TaxID=999883 RepID=F2WLM4_9VIRU|nr:hypothetical protein LAU_0296 [Lausannevirus]AEA07147.1 conserved hypothetical protein [Lausannevirus]